MAPIRTAKGGAIAFADFGSVQMATNALHRLRSMQIDGNVPQGINVSYDKDDSEEKRKEKEAKYIKTQALKLCQSYHCRLCSESALSSVLIASAVCGAAASAEGVWPCGASAEFLKNSASTPCRSPSRSTTRVRGCPRSCSSLRSSVECLIQL